MLNIKNLRVSYQGTSALDNISFTVAPGSLVGIFGPNGAGKSTLIKAMLGLVKSTGQVLYNDRPLQRQLSQVAYVPQRSNIDWDYPVTVEQVVMMARTIPTGWGRSPDRQSWQLVKEALARVGMEKYSDRQIGELSGGQQQRVFLARSLAAQASLLFFDEPFSGIDRQTEAIMFEILVELKTAGKTILVISHDWGESLKNYDYLLMLNKGVIAAGESQDVLHQRNILQSSYDQNVQNYFLAAGEGFPRSA